MFITLIISVVLPVALSSCGSVRTHWGIEGDYELPFGDDDYYRQKHKKHKKHKSIVIMTMTISYITTTMKW